MSCVESAPSRIRRDRSSRVAGQIFGRLLSCGYSLPLEFLFLVGYRGLSGFILNCVGTPVAIATSPESEVFSQRA
jgi:hypothetical protein